MTSAETSPYVLLERIGAGGVGEVHLARDERLNRKVALKFLSEAAGQDHGARRRFVLEARAAAAIDHPFVCKVFEAGIHENRAFIAMEYVEGETLDKWLTSSPPFDARLRVACEAAEAIEEAHTKGFLHRDLKPANLMVTSGGHMKVLDFGIAKSLNDEGAEPEESVSVAGQVWGTLEYLSPEQAAGDPLDQRSDLFSFGIVLYEMFTGVHPFRRATPFKSAMAIMARPHPRMQDQDAETPDALREVIDRLLEKLAPDRFDSMAAVHRALLAVSDPVGAPVERPHNSVAVLPFSRLSSNEEDEYFVDGMTEEIITRLSKLEGLKVISRTSVMRYKTGDEDLSTIGRRLGVTTVVEGSVRRAADQFRIAARLIAVSSDRQLWGEVYDRSVKDVFAVQAEVSEEIALALKQKLSVAPREPVAPAQANTLETYNEYLKGRYSMNKWTPDGIRTGIRHFENAIGLDPGYARGYAGLSMCHAYSGHLGYEPFATAFPAAKKAADRALSLDDSLAEATVSLALVALLHDWDWDAAGRHFERAIVLNPNFAAARLHYAWYHLAIGRNDRAVAEAARAVELDPLSAFNLMVFGWIQFYSGLYTESLIQYRKALELEPDHQLSRDQIGGTLLAMGRFDEAIENLENAANPAHLAWAYAIAGRRDEAVEVLDRITEPSSGVPATRMDLGVAHLLMEELDTGFGFMEEAYQERDSRLPYMPRHPFLVSVRSDPRMIDLATRIGLDAHSL